jgi:hypothetical protein
MQEGSDADTMIAEGGSTLCNLPDDRVASLNARQCLLEVLVASLNTKSQVRTSLCKSEFE